MKRTSALMFLIFVSAALAMPPGYKGKPFKDQSHKSGPQAIPGTLQLALYDLGGEGVAYHDSDEVNQGAKLNRTEFMRGGRERRPYQALPARHA